MQIENRKKMETQVAYTTSMKPTRIRKAPRKAKPIPEGYMSLDEFGSLFHQKLDEVYAKIHV